MADSLMDAVGAFLAPLLAECGDLEDYGDADMPVQIVFGGDTFQTTLAAFQRLDAAHQSAFDRAETARCSRRNRKAVGDLLTASK